MNKLLTELVTAEQSYPCVTIVIPLARAMPERTHNVTRLRDLMKDAIKLLKEQAPGKNSEILIKKLEKLIEAEDFTTTSSDGLAILVNKDLQHIIPLVGEVDQLIHVGHYFALSALAGYMHDVVKYLTVVMSEEKARLFVTTYAQAEEVITPLTDDKGNPLQGFPLTALRPEDKVVASVGSGDRGADYSDAEINRFVRLVASELHKYVEKEKLPVVLCGSATLLEQLDEALHGKVPVVARVIGDYINEAPQVIGKLAWHVILQHRNEQIAHDIREFQEAAGHNKQACGLIRTWETAHAGRVHHLFVERGLSVTGRIDPENPEHLQLMPAAPGVSVDNCIDIVVAQVVQHAGMVTVVPRGALETCEGVGAILRY